jgi:hypothetical protein
MPFGRRRGAHRTRETNARDPFDHLADERRAAEAEAWFLQPDDAPAIDVQAGVSSNITEDDLVAGTSGGGTSGDGEGNASGAADAPSQPTPD